MKDKKLKKESFLNLRVNELEKRALKNIAAREGKTQHDILLKRLHDDIHTLMTKKGLSYVQALKRLAK